MVSVEFVAVNWTAPAVLVMAPSSVSDVAARKVTFAVAFTIAALVEEMELFCEVTLTAPAVAVSAEASVRVWPAVSVMLVPLMSDAAWTTMLVPPVKLTAPAEALTAPVSEMSAAVAIYVTPL